jgi:uncharacterized membrane protein
MKKLTARRDERGAILVMSTVGVVVAVIAAALAVDLGRIAQERRDDQRVADLAALDAARDLSQMQALAEASAVRNNFPLGGGNTIVAVEGVKTDGACVPMPGAGTVCVTVTSDIDYAFRPGGRPIVATAVAGEVPRGGFMIGSSLVTVDSSRATILNNFVGRIIRGSAVNLSVASWQGLATGHVSLEALRLQLANLGYTVGDTQSLLDTNITVSTLLQAMANALNAQGDVARADIVNVLRLAVTSTTNIALGQFINVAQGAEEMALASQVNVLQMITAAAQVANGSNFVDVPNIGITVPGLLGTRLRLQVIEPPQFYFGPEGGSVSTGQVDLLVETDLNLSLNVLGLSNVTARGKLPVRISAAGATGTLTDIECGAGAGMTVTIDPTAFAGSATTDPNGIIVRGTVLIVPLDLVRIGVTSVVPTVDGPPVDKFWSYPSQFPPPDGTTTSQHAGSQPIGLQGLTTFTASSVEVLGLVDLGLLNSIVSALINALTPLIGNVDNNVLTPLLSAFGVDIGSADVTALSMQCGQPMLLG